MEQLLIAFIDTLDASLKKMLREAGDGSGFAGLTIPQLNYLEAIDALGEPTIEVRSAYLLRLLSLVLSAVTVWLIYFMVREIWPNENMLALATAFFVATIPQFVHISASISNTTLATTLSTAYLLSLMYYLKNNLKPARAFLCGILLGCALLSSTFTIFYVPVTICIILWIFFRTGKNILTGLLIILSVAGFVSGWWFIRNWTHYHDPLLSRAIVAVYPWIVRSRMPSLGDLSEVIENSFISFFGSFCWNISIYHFNSAAFPWTHPGAAAHLTS